MKSVLFLPLFVFVQLHYSHGLYPAIKSIHTVTANSNLQSENPFSLSSTPDGMIVALDSADKVMVVGNGVDGTMQYERPFAHGTPYSQIFCPKQNAVIVSYARSHLLNVFAIDDDGESTGLDFSNAFASFPHVIISDMTANKNCDTLYVLDGVNKLIYSVISKGRTQPFFLLTNSNIITPTSILFSETEKKIFLADWGGASIYAISGISDPSKTLTRLAGDGTPRLIRDSNDTHSATLSGPTQLALYKPGVAILFTDRNPVLNTSAVRTLQISGPYEGRIETIAGGNYRGSSNGNTTMTQKLNACWDVAYEPISNEIYVSEPLSNNIRRLYDISVEWGKCNAGTFKNLNESASNLNNCNICMENMWCPGNDFAYRCPEGLFSHAGAVATTQCWCGIGLYSIEGQCNVCPKGRYCPTFSNTSLTCPGGKDSNRYAVAPDECACANGKYLNNQTCTFCPKDHFCHSEQKFQCPLNSFSVKGIASIANCTCKQGYKKSATGDTCRPCESDEVCTNSVVRVNTQIGFVTTKAVSLSLCQTLNNTNGEELRDAIRMRFPNTSQDLLGTASDITLIELDGTCIISSKTSPRRLLALLTLSSETSEWVLEIETDMILDESGTIDEYNTALLNIFNGPASFAAILSAATNTIISPEDVLVPPGSIQTTYSNILSDNLCNTEGKVAINSICVCMPGYTGDALLGDCEKCPVATYKSSPGNGACLQCGEHMVTVADGASTSAQCKCDDGYKKDKNTKKCEKSSEFPLTVVFIVVGVIGGLVIIAGVYFWNRTRTARSNPTTSSQFYSATNAPFPPAHPSQPCHLHEPFQFGNYVAQNSQSRNKPPILRVDGLLSGTKPKFR